MTMHKSWVFRLLRAPCASGSPGAATVGLFCALLVASGGLIAAEHGERPVASTPAGRDAGASSRPASRPSCGELRQIQANGLNLACWTLGSGPVCVCPTPGDGLDSYVYRNTLQPLGQAFTVVFLDTRGTGQSDRPRDPDGYTLEEFVSDVAAVRAELEADKVWIFGHDLAGRLAVRYATMQRQHCAGIILVGASPAFDDEAYDDVASRAPRKVMQLQQQAPDLWKEGDKTLPCLPASDDELRKERVAGLAIHFHSPRCRAR